jgi:hypothetical protein
MEFRRRTKTIQAPSVEDPEIFPEGSIREFVAQNLEGPEVAFARERVKKNKAMAELLDKFMGSSIPKVVEAAKEQLGLSDLLPSDYVYRIALIEFGTQSPEMSQEKAVRLGKNSPVVFYSLSDEILGLTAMGAQPGE